MMNRQLKFSKFLIAVSLTCFAAISFAQDGKMYPIEAPKEPNAIPLNTGGVENQPAKESWFRQWGDPMARNITEATLTPYLADPKKANGTSVIVAPGGGFMWLSMANEGWEVAEALAARGINAFVLKYRLHPTADSLDDFSTQMDSMFARAAEMSKETNTPAERPRRTLDDQVADEEAADSLIKSRAKDGNVDMNKLGMMGFSAGARLTMATTLQSKKVKLAFIAPIYGALNAVEVPKVAPRMFAAIAVDDFLFHGETGLIKSWYDAKIPVEL